jgi:aspartate-semialdehyde dehydrogenase
MTPASSRLVVAIAGASSLRGKEMAEVLEERNFPSTDIHLLDDAVAEGVLTEAGGEPIIIQGTNEDSFDGVRFAFFTGGADFTGRHWQQALRGGATVIDLSGALRSEPKAVPWIPALRKPLPPPRMATGKLFFAPSAPVIIACTLAAAAKEAGAERLAIVFFQPVSERGQAGIEELESQAVNLLSLKPIAKELYGEQVAFNFLGGYGEAGQETLAGVRAEICAAVKEYLNERAPMPAIQLVQAPVFHGYAFSAFVDFAGAPRLEALQAALESAGVRVAANDADAPSNVSVAGESQIVLGRLEAAPGTSTSCWLWGAADNLRLAAANAVSIAETLLAS